MIEEARRIINEFMTRLPHFRPEDRKEFIDLFLTQYCGSCGGMLYQDACPFCSPDTPVVVSSP